MFNATYFSSIFVGCSLDQVVRTLQMLLALKKTTSISVFFERKKAHSPWMSLLEDQEQVDLFNITSSNKHNPYNATSFQILCRPSYAIHRDLYYNHYLLIMANAQCANKKYFSYYKEIFGFAPFNHLKKTYFNSLPICVDKIFTSNIKKINTTHLLVISDGNIMYTEKICKYFQRLGIHNITVFEPYFSKSIYQQKKTMDNVFIAEACSTKNRFDIFKNCTHAIVANPMICTDNHFLWEASASGSMVIADHTHATIRPRSIWNLSILESALSKCTTSPMQREINDWHHIADHIQLKEYPKKTFFSYKHNQHHIDIYYSIYQLSQQPCETDTILIVPNKHAIWQEEFNSLFITYRNIYIDSTKNKNFYHDCIKNCIICNIYNINDFNTSLSDACQNTISNKVHVLYIKKYDIPMILKLGYTPNINEVLSESKIGIQVACENIMSSLLHDSEKRYNMMSLNKEDTTKIPKLLENNDIDLILFLDPIITTAIIARRIWAKKSIPIVGMLHSIHTSQISTCMIEQLLNGPTYDFDTIISPSICGMIAYKNALIQVENWLKKTTGRPFKSDINIEVIPYGIDTTVYNNLHKVACKKSFHLKEDHIVFLSLGRINKQEKNDLLPLLIATQQLIKKQKNVTLMIAGGAQENSYDFLLLQETIKNLGLNDYVKIFPNVSSEDKSLLYGAADVFISLSDNIQETFGLSIIEAMAASLPIIAAAWNGYREIIQHEKNGFLIPTYWANIQDKNYHIQRICTNANGYGHRDLHESMIIDPEKIFLYMYEFTINTYLRKKFSKNSKIICDREYDRYKQSRKMGNLFIDLIKKAQKSSFLKKSR